MKDPTEIAKQIADLIRGDQIAALYVREFLSAAELVDLLGLHRYVNEQVGKRVWSFEAEIDDLKSEIHHLKRKADDLRADNRRLEREAAGLRDEIARLEVERLLSGKARD